MGGKTVNPSIRIYANKIENRNMFKIKTEHYLEILTPETMRLLGSTKSKIAKMNMVEIAETAGDLIGSKIADKITRVSKNPPQYNSEIN